MDHSQVEADLKAVVFLVVLMIMVEGLGHFRGNGDHMCQPPGFKVRDLDIMDRCTGRFELSEHGFAGIDHVWGGTLGITMNRMPHFARLGDNGLSLSGYSGHGLAMATLAGQIAAETIAGVETVTLDYEMLPRCTYCQPQVASFGITEAQAVERGHQVKVGQFPFRAIGKALGLGDYDGFVKIVADETSGEILGASLVGPEVTELLPELVLARHWELTPEEIADGHGRSVRRRRR